MLNLVMYGLVLILKVWVHGFLTQVLQQRQYGLLVLVHHQQHGVPQAAHDQLGYRLPGSQLPGPAKVETHHALRGAVKTGKFS